MNTQTGLFKRWLRRAGQVDWEAIFVAELPRVYNYFRYYGLPDAIAEDLTSATFEKAWRAQHTYQSNRASAATWLLAIARHTVADYLRAQRPEVSLDRLMDGLAEPDSGPEESLQRREEAQRLRACLRRLPERERELLALKYGADMTNRAIANATGLSETNVGSILHRVIATLRAQMEKDQ